MVKTGNKIRIIPETDIWYLEADGDYVTVHTPEGKFLKSRTMQYFENTLDARKFVRVHRSYIIQLQQMVRLEPYEKDSHVAILKSGAQVPVSRTGNTRLKQVLGY